MPSHGARRGTPRTAVTSPHTPSGSSHGTCRYCGGSRWTNHYGECLDCLRRSRAYWTEQIKKQRRMKG